MLYSCVKFHVVHFSAFFRLYSIDCSSLYGWSADPADLLLILVMMMALLCKEKASGRVRSTILHISQWSWILGIRLLVVLHHAFLSAPSCCVINNRRFPRSLKRSLTRGGFSSLFHSYCHARLFTVLQSLFGQNASCSLRLLAPQLGKGKILSKWLC